MKRIFLPLLLILFSYPAFAKEPIRIINGTVVKVVDGDTVQIRDSVGTKVKIRLYGIDAPETEKSNQKTGKVSKPGQPFGGEAFQALKEKVNRQKVRVEVMDIDRYQRAVSILRFGSRNINAEMVKEGFAWAYRQYLQTPYRSEFISFEEQARKERRGLWQKSNPQPPWEFRKSLRAR